MGRGSFIVITPERVADHLEKLIDDPAELREQVEANVIAQLKDAEVTARFGAVLLRRIRDRQLYLPCGWPSWEAFCAFFSPEEPGRIDILIRALEVLESRGEKRDFGEPEARELAGHGGDRRSEQARKDQGNRVTLNRGNRVDYLEARLRQEHPEIFAALKRGEYPTAKEAARAAGIVKPPDAYKQLVRWWGEASAEERAHFEVYIAWWRREEAGAA